MEATARFVGRLLALALLQAFVGIQSGQCQTKLDLFFTNRVVTFTNLEGELFVNADLIEADASQVVFKTNDIFGAVRFTNLSRSTLESLGIPLSRLGLAHELAVQKAEAVAKQQAILRDEQEKLLDPANLIKLKVDSVTTKDYDAIYGQLYLCNAKQGNGMAARVFVARLPDTVPAYFDQRAALAQDIAQLSAQIDARTSQITAGTANMKQAQFQVNQANAVTPTYAAGDADSVNAAMAQRSAVNLAQVNINATADSLADATAQVVAWRQQLQTEQRQLDKMNRAEQSTTVVFVLRSHYLHNGFPVVICAPPRGAVRRCTVSTAL